MFDGGNEVGRLTAGIRDESMQSCRCRKKTGTKRDVGCLHARQSSWQDGGGRVRFRAGWQTDRQTDSRADPGKCYFASRSFADAWRGGRAGGKLDRGECEERLGSLAEEAVL